MLERDPIFAAIEEHDAAWLAISNTSECGETTKAMRDAETSACAELSEMTPRQRAINGTR